MSCLPYPDCRKSHLSAEINFTNVCFILLNLIIQDKILKAMRKNY